MATEDVKHAVARRLLLKEIGRAIEGQASAKIGAQEATAKIVKQKDQLKINQVQIAAYKLLVERLTRPGVDPLDYASNKDVIWDSCVKEAVARLRAAGQRIEEKHIPLKREVVDLSKEESFVLEVRELPIVDEVVVLDQAAG
jgi:hypothetical protein